ncbi:MAG: SPASM domain-containing protein, partial [Eubacteriales bacterium]
GGGDIGITEADLPKIFAEYENLAAVYLERRKAGRPFNFFHFMIDLESGPCLNKRLRGCGAGSEYVAVTPGGDMYPCHQFAGTKEFFMGNVFGDKMDAEISKKFTSCHVFAKEKCASCWAKYYCSGGCFSDAYFTNGDIAKPNDITCEIEKKRVETAIALKILETEEREAGQQ